MMISEGRNYLLRFYVASLPRDGTEKAVVNGSLWWPKLLLKWHQLKPNTKILFQSPRTFLSPSEFMTNGRALRHGSGSTRHSLIPTSSRRVKFNGAFLTMSSFLHSSWQSPLKGVHRTCWVFIKPRIMVRRAADTVRYDAERVSGQLHRHKSYASID